MRRKDKIVLAVLLSGLLFSSYFRAPARSGGACPAVFGLLAAQPLGGGMVNGSSPHQVAPDWHLTGINGKRVSLSDFKGKVVLLNFWATWCPPCRREIPALVALQKRYADKGLVIVGVSMDEGGEAAVKPFTKKAGINYPVVIGDQKIAAAYGGIQVLPSTFIIDKTGKIAGQHEGDADLATFDAEIKPLL